jgi:hypothetical protein
VLGRRAHAVPVRAHVYPDTGNGGYASVHTDVHLVYDATANKFLPGNRVVLTDRATQCLTSFSLDYERKSANTADGPDMKVRSVTVNGHPAAFTFVQPTYPGDPTGQDDPSPLAHEASQNNPVGPQNNPLPPASTTAAAARSAGPQEGQRRTMVPLSRSMASRSAAASGRSPGVSDSTGPLNQWPRGHRILALSSGPSVELIR